MKKKLFNAFILSLLAILFISCSDEDTSIIPQVDNGNFSIYVSNQSASLDPVDIKILIDGKLAINQEFAWLNGSNHIKFQYRLDNRQHRLTVSSIKGQMNKDTTFTPSTTPYSSVSLWYNPSQDGGDDYKDISIKFLVNTPIFASIFINGFYVFV